MKKTTLLGTLTLCGFAALVSCDNGASTTSGLADDDCPIGTFRPPGHPTCVFAADDQFGNPLGVSDNRCASGQPALPPVCVSNEGGRTYFSMTTDCAPGYRFEPGACQRSGAGTGAAGSFGTGAPTGFFPGTGEVTGFAGTTGAAGTGAGGEAGSPVMTGSGTGAAAVAGN